MKNNNLTLKINVATFVSIVFSLFFYGVFVPLLMKYNMEQTVMFEKKLIVNIFTIGILATIFVYLIYKPAEKIIKLIDDGEKVSVEKIKEGLHAIERIPSLLFLIGCVSYLFGVAFQYLPSYMSSGVIDMEEFTGRIAIAVVWGVINGLITARILNYFLQEAKQKFEIYYPEGIYDKNTAIVNRIFFPGLSLVFFVIVLNIVLFKSYLSEPADIYSVVISVALINILILAFTGVLFYIIVFESLSYFKTLSLQLNNLLQEEMNLSRKIVITNFDDTGLVTGKINKVIDKLAGTFKEIKGSTQSVFSADKAMHEGLNDTFNSAGRIEKDVIDTEKELLKLIDNIDLIINKINGVLSITQKTIEEGNNQADKINTTSTSLKNMINSFDKVLNLTVSLDEDFKELIVVVNQSSASIQEAYSSINEINLTGQKVANIAGIISDIAAKTNLLSMNASIEAAHAGDQGKGFAVVANEIRKLSSDTSNSAKLITNLTTEINDKIKNGVTVFDNMNSICDRLKNDADKMTKTINDISNNAGTQMVNANANVAKIDDLMRSSALMKQNSMKQYDQIDELKNVIDVMNSDTKKMSETEHEMTEGMKLLLRSFQSIKELSIESFNSIANLEKLISTFIIE